MRRTWVISLVWMAGCSGSTPHASVGAARDAGPPGDTGTIVYVPHDSGPPPIDAAPSVNDPTSTGAPPGAPTGCAPDGTFEVIGAAVDGESRTDVVGTTWTFTDGGTRVDGDGVPFQVECVARTPTGSQIRVHGGLVGATPTTTFDAFVVGWSDCFTITSLPPTGGLPASGPNVSVTFEPTSDLGP